MTPMRAGLVRVGATGLFVAAFFGVWQPVRSALAVHVVGPLLEGAVGGVEALASPPSVRVGGGEGAPSYSVPAGLHFLVPGLLLVAVAPRRLYWLVLLGVLLALGLVMLAAFALGLAGVPGGLAVHGLLHTYVVPPASLGVALFLLERHRRAEAGTAHVPSPLSSEPPIPPKTP